MTSPDNDNLARIIEAAANPVAQPCPGWHPGIDGLDQSDEMNIRRALWREMKQPIIVPWLEGLRIRLFPGNELSRIIYLAGQFEPNEFWWLKRFLKPGMSIVDVGANMGTYSLFSAALVGADGRVISIEPSERDHGWLVDNVRLNGLENVSCIKAAVAAGPGTARLKVASNWNSGHNTLGNYGYEATEHLADEDVVLTTLDAIVDDCGLARVDFIKMDIEGAELAALQGATATLRKHRPVLLVEIADRTLRHQGASSVDVLDFLHDHGYRVFRFDAPRRRLVPAVRKGSYDSENLFAIPVGAEIPIAYDVTADTGGGAEAEWNLKWMDIPEVVTPPPEPSGWRQDWYGYHVMEKVHSRSFVQAVKASHSQTGVANAIQERDIEQQALLNILVDSPCSHFNMVELGAGYGDWSMALAGVLDHALLGGQKRTYRCVAVEAEPIHYEWAKEHFEKQNIRGEAIWGAVYNHNGECWLAAPDLPENHYGQSVHATEGNVRVPCYTLREIMARSGLDRIDIIHMDIQGAEMDVVLDSLDLFAAGLIRYVIIGTHDPEFNSRIRALLGDYMTFHIDVPTYAGFDMTPFGIANFPVDGILLGRSKVPDPAASGQTIRIDTLVSVPRPLSPAQSKSMPFRHLELTVRDELAAGRELNAVRLIRRWAAQRATVVRDERYATHENPRAPEEYIAGYENLTIMGVCNQTADFLAQLYDRFGFSSATLGAGLQGQLSHAVTLVNVRHEGREITMIQDAYINAEFALEGEEPTSFSRILLATILDPDGIRLANHFPQDRRQKILYSQKEWEIMTAVPMFDGDDWLHMESKRAARQYLAFRLNKAEERVIPADMFLFPLYITGYRSSPHLMREITFYRHMAPYLTQSLAEFGRDAVIETLNSQEAVGLI